MTWSPAFTVVTPGPTDSTTPAASCPRMQGKRPSGSCPSRVYASVWHSAVATTLMRTSPSWGGETMTSVISRGCLAAQAMAAEQVMG